ncbi:MAG: hypothetical protein ACRC67_00990 [Inquilinus sp.]|uniref:hypothetical protein n=1 Tax=Inquilinus sp. TaxID=1932117 RepID=UPI003F3BAE11
MPIRKILVPVAGKLNDDNLLDAALAMAREQSAADPGCRTRSDERPTRRTRGCVLPGVFMIGINALRRGATARLALYRGGVLRLWAASGR